MADANKWIKFEIEFTTGTRVDITKYVKVAICEDSGSVEIATIPITLLPCGVCHKPAKYTNYLNTEYYCEKHVPHNAILW